MLQAIASIIQWRMKVLSGVKRVPLRYDYIIYSLDYRYSDVW